MPAATVVHLVGSAAMVLRTVSRTTCQSSGSSSCAVGTTPAASQSTPVWIRRVASPPSSRIMLGPVAPAKSAGQVRICSVHHQYSGSVSFFQANTGTPCGSSGVPCGPTTAAAAAVVGPHGTPDDPQGVPVFAWKNETLPEYWWCTCLLYTSDAADE